MKIAMVALTSLLAGSAMADGFFRDDCRYTAKRNASMPAAGISKVVIHAEAGSLRVDGVNGATAFVVTGTACTSEEDFLSRMTLTLRKVGTELHIDANIPEKNVVFGFFSARIDFALTMPAGLPVVIDDESGSIKVSNTGALTIDDDSGSIEVRNVRGNLEIRDDSGSISIETVQGDVGIEDVSGSIEIRDVAGNVQIEDDSGSIMAQNIQRDVTIDRDGSGSIDVADVGGNFTVGRKTSGGIDHIRVAGKVEIPSRY